MLSCDKADDWHIIKSRYMFTWQSYDFQVICHKIVCLMSWYTTYTLFSIYIWLSLVKKLDFSHIT